MKQTFFRNNHDEIKYDKKVDSDLNLDKSESDIRKIERILKDLEDFNTVFDKAQKYIK